MIIVYILLLIASVILLMAWSWKIGYKQGVKELLEVLKNHTSADNYREIINLIKQKYKI